MVQSIIDRRDALEQAPERKKLYGYEIIADLRKTQISEALVCRSHKNLPFVGREQFFRQIWGAKKR